MLSSIIRFSIRRRAVALALAALLMVYGGYRLQSAGLDIFPEFAPQLVVAQTEAPGFSAEQVERLVTRPIETALGGLLGLRSIRSESIQGLSIVQVFFAEGSDVFRNRQLLSERLVGVNERLPVGAGPARALPLASSSATILSIGLASDALDLMRLRDMADYSIAPRILSVAGVADVHVFGGEVRQLQIQLLPEALRRHGLGVNEVSRAAREAVGIHGAGFIENENQRIALRVAAPADGGKALGRVVIRRQKGRAITLADVARIDYGAEPPYGAASVMGKPGIVMMIIGQYGANTLTVSRAVERELADLAAALRRHGVALHPDLFRPADYIEESLRNISGHLLIGAVFVLIVLLLFLYDARAALISALAIPLSLLSAAVLLLELGFNLNIMILGGLAIALGEVVDDAIIDTENIFRRLRENAVAKRPRKMAEVVFRAAMEVRSSVVYASFIVALVFVPLLVLSGVAGRLFSPLAVAYILAILMSLLVALTVTPALCCYLPRKNIALRAAPPLLEWIQPRYARLLSRLNRSPRATMAATGAFCLVAVSLLPFAGARFLPELREGHYIAHTTAAPGTSLDESIRIGNRLTEAFLQIPGVRSVSQWAGRAERGADTYGSHYSEYEIDLHPLSGGGQEAVLRRLREILAAFPGIRFEANTFLIERVDETISGYTSPVVVNLYGEDLDYLDRKAAEVARLMAAMPGAADTQVRSPPGTPTLEIEMRPERLAFYGLRPAQVTEWLAAAYRGLVVGKTPYGDHVIDVSLILPPESRRRPEDVAALPLRTPAGAVIALADVADIRLRAGRYNILHQDGRRLQTVTCNVQGVALDRFMRDLKRRVLAEIDFAADTYPEFTGAALERRQARRELLLYSGLAGAAVLLLIYVAIGNVRNMLLMLANLPFSLAGGAFAVMLTGATMSVGSMVGFVTLFGITVRNSIMLVSHYEHLLREEGCAWNADTLLRGAQERLPSILMTALVTALAMLPIAVDSDNAGREIMGPMAAIIIGGLLSSTVLNLLIMPVMLFRFGDYPGSDYPRGDYSQGDDQGRDDRERR